MQTTDLITLYKENGWVKALIELLHTNSSKTFQLKGLAGSLPPLLGATIYKYQAPTQLFILPDKEAAAYFYSDLQNLVFPTKVLLYPAVLQKPYEPESVATAETLMRTEVLQQLSKANASSQLIITYPEALTNQVIAQDSFIGHIWRIQIGDKLLLFDLVDKLTDQGFERTDFVYEAGQFAVRGGLLDVFSYANQFPYRIELFGQEVESIRTFDPTDQRSLEAVQQVAIVPYMRASNSSLTYQSFLDFLYADTLVWLKDYELILHTLGQKYQQAQAAFESLQAQQAQPAADKPLPHPDALYEQPATWEQKLQRLSCLILAIDFIFSLI